MGNKGSVYAWVAAGIAAVAVVACLANIYALVRDVAVAESESRQAREEAKLLQEKGVQQAEEVRQLEAKVSQLEEQLAAGLPDAAGLADAADAAGVGADAAGSVGEAGTAQAGAGEGGPAALMKMFEGEQGKKIAEASAESALGMQYGDLFSQLALPPETEEKVRGVFRNFLVQQIQASARFMRGGEDMKGAKEAGKEMEAQMEKELASLLNQDGMAIYEQYKEELPERMLRKSFDMQLGMMASGLSQESRGMVIDVLVEEMLPQTGEDKWDAMGTAEGFQQQFEAFDRSRERLSTVLDEQQMAEVDRFLQQQRSAMEMFRQMMPQKTDDGPQAVTGVTATTSEPAVTAAPK